MSEQTLVERLEATERWIQTGFDREGQFTGNRFTGKEACELVSLIPDTLAELSRLSEALRKAGGALEEAGAVVADLLVSWPDGSVPSGPLCLRATRVIAAALSTPMPSEGGGSSSAERRVRPSARTEAQHSAGGWRPIASAPMDGTRFDLWVPRHPETATPRRVPDCRWARPRWDRRLGPGEPAADYATWCDALGHGGYEPTHWMPPPAPPSSAKQVVGDSSRDEQPPRTGEG
jgi:hypothetical protein